MQFRWIWPQIYKLVHLALCESGRPTAGIVSTSNNADFRLRTGRGTSVLAPTMAARFPRQVIRLAVLLRRRTKTSINNPVRALVGVVRRAEIAKDNNGPVSAICTEYSMVWRGFAILTNRQNHSGASAQGCFSAPLQSCRCLCPLRAGHNATLDVGDKHPIGASIENDMAALVVGLRDSNHAAAQRGDFPVPVARQTMIPRASGHSQLLLKMLGM